MVWFMVNKFGFELSTTHDFYFLLYEQNVQQLHLSWKICRIVKTINIMVIVQIV